MILVTSSVIFLGKYEYVLICSALLQFGGLDTTNQVAKWAAFVGQVIINFANRALLAQGYMYFKFFPVLVAIQMYIAPVMRTILQDFVGMKESPPLFILISIAFTLVFIFVEKKLDPGSRN